MTSGGKLVDECWQTDTAASMRLEADLQSSVMGGANQMEAVAANLGNRAPDFRDPKS